MTIHTEVAWLGVAERGLLVQGDEVLSEAQAFELVRSIIDKIALVRLMNEGRA